MTVVPAAGALGFFANLFASSRSVLALTPGFPRGQEKKRSDVMANTPRPIQTLICNFQIWYLKI
jgi:hypothetical protein